jgi:hypothetical protein
MFAVSILLFCIVNGRASAQTDTVYVSGGSNIYKVQGGVVSPVTSLSGANFESLAIGPDSVDIDSVTHNAAHPFLLYACDTQGNRIIRFDPTAATIVQQQVYNASVSVSGLVPECGRSAASGDFFFTNKAGAGVYKFSNLANIPFGSANLPTAPTLVSTSPAFPATMTGRGITQKNNGDLLVVNNAGNQVLRSPYSVTPPTQTTFAGSNLSGPVGIARLSTGDVFVANSAIGRGSSSSPVAHFDRSGNVAATCGGLTFSSNQVPASLAASQSDALYLVSASNSKGTVWSWSPTQGDCSLVPVATTPTAVFGVAVTPGSFGTITKPVVYPVTNPGPTIYDFNSHGFQITAKGCTGTVTPFAISPATVSSMISRAAGLLSSSQPALNLGEAGFEVAYVAKWPDPAGPQPGNCASVFSDGQFVNQIFGVFDNNITNNPRIVRCDGSANEPFLDSNTSCTALSTLGVYPLGGTIPDDPATSVRGTSNSTFVLVNEALSPIKAGTFCGFESPLIDTQIASKASTFKSGATKTITVKFKLAQQSGTCQNGPYITDATALISLGQISDSTGKSLLNAIAIGSTSVGNADAQPLFNQGNQQYQFTLDISNLAVGTYSVTVTFLSNNTYQHFAVFNVK